MTAGESGSSIAQCPLCLPRDRVDTFSIHVARLSVSTLYLDRNQTYRGRCVLVFDPRHVEGLEHLSDHEFDALLQDLRAVSRAVAAVCSPDLMNYASLGNVIPHLHWHVIPRYRSDPRWGGPIYTTAREEMHETYLDDSEYATLVSAIREALKCYQRPREAELRQGLADRKRRAIGPG